MQFKLPQKKICRSGSIRRFKEPPMFPDYIHDGVKKVCCLETNFLSTYIFYYGDSKNPNSLIRIATAISLNALGKLDPLHINVSPRFPLYYIEKKVSLKTPFSYFGHTRNKKGTIHGIANNKGDILYWINGINKVFLLKKPISVSILEKCGSYISYAAQVAYHVAKKKGYSVIFPNFYTHNRFKDHKYGKIRILHSFYTLKEGFWNRLAQKKRHQSNSSGCLTLYKTYKNKNFAPRFLTKIVHRKESKEIIKRRKILLIFLILLSQIKIK